MGSPLRAWLNTRHSSTTQGQELSIGHPEDVGPVGPTSQRSRSKNLQAAPPEDVPNIFEPPGLAKR
eukprot:1449070-Pyramimonas_sp.AAC.1